MVVGRLLVRSGCEVRQGANLITSENLRDYLRRLFPESAEQVAEVEREWSDDQSVNTYMSEAFWWGHLHTSER